MNAAATQAIAMLSNSDFFGEPVAVTDEQHDRDLAAWALGHRVRMVTSFDCSSGDCITDPDATWHEMLELITDLQPEDTHLRAQCRIIMEMCSVLKRDRATGASA